MGINIILRDEYTRAMVLGIRDSIGDHVEQIAAKEHQAQHVYVVQNMTSPVGNLV